MPNCFVYQPKLKTLKTWWLSTASQSVLNAKEFNHNDGLQWLKESMIIFMKGRIAFLVYLFPINIWS